MIRLALVSLPANDSIEALPLGAACVSAAVSAAASLRGKVEPFLLEGRLGEAPADLASRIASSGGDWAGFSVYSWSRKALCAAARAFRAARPGALLFAGGPEATAEPEALLAEGSFDFLVAGEGESAAVRALELALAKGIPGFLGGAEVPPGVALPGRPFRRAPAEDAAALASPWLSGSLAPRPGEGLALWELARGCPYRCAYCYESKGEAGVRRLPLPRLKAELELFRRSGVGSAFVLDPTFNADRRRAAELLGLMAGAPGIRWKLELRAELLDAATVERLAGLDCSVQVGLQSSKAETLARLGRGFDREAFARGLRLLDRAGVVFGLDLIYGLPGDALRDFEASLDYALGFGPNHLDLFPLALLPGTELWDRAAELGLEASPEPPYLVRRTRELPEADLARAAGLAAAADRFYSAGRAVGWFRAALAPLKERPSAFLGRYGARGKAAPGAGGKGQAAIEAEQLGFLESSYRERGLERLWPALRDLVRLHGAMSRALAEGESAELELGYDPDELLAAPALGLRRFAAEARRLPGAVRVSPGGQEGVRVERARGPGRRGGRAAGRG